MGTRVFGGAFALLFSGLVFSVGCGGDDSGGGAGGSAGASQGGSAGAHAGGTGAVGGSGAAANGGSASGGSATGGGGGIPTECQPPITGELAEFAPLVDLASFNYYSATSCGISSGASGAGPFSVVRATSTSGTATMYAADVFAPWEWVSFSEGQLAGDNNQEIRPLPEDTDISVTVRNTTDQSELDIVFRVSGTQLTVSSVSAGG